MPINKDEAPGSTSCLLAFGDELARGVTPLDVCRAVTRLLPSLMNADMVVVYQRDARRAGELIRFTSVLASQGASAADYTAVSAMVTSGSITRSAMTRTGVVYKDLFRAIPATVQTVAHVALSHDHIVVAGWNDEATMDDARWRLLESAARQAGAAMERIDALRKVQELSLEDPSTGLGNRRLIEVVLERSFARSHRGEPLSIVSIRPSAKSEETASEASNRIAEWLRVKARGSDVAAYLSEGVYVIVLHASSADGADIFMRRILASLDQPEVDYAVAEQDGSFSNPGELLQDVLKRVGIDPAMN